MARFSTLLAAIALLTSGCSTVSESTPSQRDLRLAGYTVTVPADAEIYETLRPVQDTAGGIAQVSYGQDLVIYPQALVVRVPDHRGTLTLYNPNTPGYTPTYLDNELCQAILTYGCPMEGFYNGMHATEALGDTGGGHYYKTVHYNRCGNQYPAGLVGHYEDASFKTRAIFDEILRSVRR